MARPGLEVSKILPHCVSGSSLEGKESSEVGGTPGYLSWQWASRVSLKAGGSQTQQSAAPGPLCHAEGVQEAVPPAAAPRPAAGGPVSGRTPGAGPEPAEGIQGHGVTAGAVAQATWRHPG